MTEPIARRFLLAVEREEDSRKMRSILEMVPKDDLMGWNDENGLDLLHHCILQNNAEAADFLLKQGYFVRPYEPKVNAYTHLAAFLGYRALVTVILQHRPDDFRISQLPLLIPPGYVPRTGFTGLKPLTSLNASSGNWTQRISSATHRKSLDRSTHLEESVTIKKGKRGSIHSLDGLVTDGSKPLERTPLDVAARARRVDCVRTILDMCVLKANPDAPNKGYLTLAALSDCPSALKLMLESSTQGRQTTEDYKAAVECCVQRVRPECLDLLLSSKESKSATKSLFKQINFFHVLYTFSSSYGKGAYGRLPDATQVLIQHGHDVNSKVPPRTYPLYTLLSNAFCFYDYSYTQYYIQCLRLLLKSGANPNFDEVEFEKRLLKQKGIKFASGRNAYSSALHCLLETVETYASQLSSPALGVKFVEECAEVLVKYKADVGKVGRIGDSMENLHGNVLHQYAKSSVTMGVDKSILRCILRFGAEPGIKVDGKYAINIYFDKLFEMFKLCEVVDTRHKYENDVNNMMSFMCWYMTSAQIREAAYIFKRSHGRSFSEQVKYYVQKVSDDFEARSKSVHPLQDLAAWRMWKLCGKQSDAVRKLPIKVELKTVILPFL